MERLREALEQLLDQELPSEDRRRIKAAVRACAGVCDIHDLRTRFSGDRTFVEYHPEVDPAVTVDVGHAVGDATEAAVRNIYCRESSRLPPTSNHTGSMMLGWTTRSPRSFEPRAAAPSRGG